MAESAAQDSPTPLASALRLLESVGLNRHLIARCAAPNCQQSAPCDPTPWVAEGLGGMPLRAFSPRMRCVCGSRRASLDVAPGPLTPDPHPAIYIFR
jgi:hypothetical protein